MSALKNFGVLCRFLAKTCSQHSSQFQPLSQPFPRSEAIALSFIHRQTQTSLEELNIGFFKIKDAIENDAIKYSRYHAESVVPLRNKIKTSEKDLDQLIIKAAQEIDGIKGEIHSLTSALTSEIIEQGRILEEESRLDKAGDVVSKVCCIFPV